MQHKAKKSLGQNFLKDKNAIRKMCDEGNVQIGDTIVEIGPGKGVLTAELLLRGAHVIAIEKDWGLIDILKERFVKEIQTGKLKLIQGDCLEYKPEGSYKLIANIPYNITGAIFKKFLSEEKQPETMVLLVQKEVAERIVARDGKESILSLSVKAYGEPKYIMRVSKKMFAPSPKVDSAVIAIHNINKKNFLSSPDKGRKGEVKLENKFFAIVKAGFAHKRKVLIKNLEKVAKKEVLEKAFTELHILTKSRAENIMIDVWLNLTRLL